MVEHQVQHSQLVNDDLQNIHNTVVPNLEEQISDEKKERLKLEIWGRKWNLVISGIEGKFAKHSERSLPVYIRLSSSNFCLSSIVLECGLLDS
jgi:hypothetical protein